MMAACVQQASIPSKQQLLDRQRMAETEHLLSKLLYSTGEGAEAFDASGFPCLISCG